MSQQDPIVVGSIASLDAPSPRDVFLSIKQYVCDKPDEVLKEQFGVAKIVGLGSNENSLGASPKVVEAIQKELVNGGLHKYPDGAADHFRDLLSRTFGGLPPDHFVIGNGSNELIALLMHTFLKPNEHMIFSQKSFFVYKVVGMGHEVPIREVPMRADFRFDLGAILEKMDEQTKIVFISNPNNPTGTHIPLAEFEEFLGKVPRHCMVVLDEAYIHYATAGDCQSGVKLLSKHGHHLIIMRTFSKAYGLAGLRVGFLIGHPKVIDVINRARQPYNVSGLSLAGACAALEDEEHLRYVVEKNAKERERLSAILTEMGCAVVPSQTNFLLVGLQGNLDAEELANALLRMGVIVRPMQGYGLPTHLRITVGTEEEDDYLISCLRTQL